MDFSTVDVLLVSSCFSMLALPFITAVSPPSLELAPPCLLVHTRREEGLARKIHSYLVCTDSRHFISQKLGFAGRTYATEPTMHFGRYAYYASCMYYLYNCCMVSINFDGLHCTCIFLLLPRQLMEELEHYIHRNPASSSTQAWKDPQLWRYGNLHHSCLCWCDNIYCFYAC